MQSHPNDTLSLHKESRLISQLQKQQKILFSCQIIKFNDANKCQTRIFLITDTSVYNVQRSQNFIKSMMSKLVNFNKKFTIKRSIGFSMIDGITLSTCEQNQFVLHVKDQYDYRFRIDDKSMKKLLLKCLCLQYEKVCNRKMVFYFKDEINLSQYCTLKSDIKHKITRKPKQSGLYLNVQDLVDYQVPGVKFELIYTQNNKPVGIEKFVSSTLEKMQENKKYFSIQQKKIQYQAIKEQMENKHTLIYLPSYIYKLKNNLYLLRTVMIGGKMDKLIYNTGPLKLELSIFYIAQIILVLEFLHQRKWIYRALSLSNLFIKDNGYIAIDGLNKFMKKVGKTGQMCFDVCGLPEDLAPEMILCSGYDESLDVWGLGLCAYNMIQGHHPFASYNIKQTFRNILDKKMEQNVPNFVRKALQKQAKQRPSLRQIKKDPCFTNINWGQIQKQLKVSPYIPELKSVHNWDGKLPSIVSLAVSSNQVKK